MESISLGELTDKVFGPKGTPDRDEYDHEVELFVIGETIKQARQSKSIPCNAYSRKNAVRKHWLNVVVQK